MRFFVRCSYKGSLFSGWQSQQNTMETVQGKIESGIHKITRKHIPIVGCGRTDAGVHASKYFFHFDGSPDYQYIAYPLNGVLPYEIAIHEILPVKDEAHARFDAESRQYQYFLHTFKDPFSLESSFFYKKKVDVDKLNEVSSLIIGNHDFKSFCKTGSDVRHFNCEVTYAQWDEIGNGRFRFTIEADRFLRGMVRLIVGASILTMEENISISQLREALISQKPIPRSWSVPGHGLFLSDIMYDTEIFL